jgi:hypothetical protein
MGGFIAFSPYLQSSSDQKKAIPVVVGATIDEDTAFLHRAGRRVQRLSQCGVHHGFKCIGLFAIVPARFVKLG